MEQTASSRARGTTLVPIANGSEGGGTYRGPRGGRSREEVASLCPIRPQIPHLSISRCLESHHASSVPSGLSLPLPFPKWGQRHLGMQRDRVRATHVIEHFIQLLGVHDEVGVAYHIVDCIRLGRRDTER